MHDRERILALHHQFPRSNDFVRSLLQDQQCHTPENLIKLHNTSFSWGEIEKSHNITIPPIAVYIPDFHIPVLISSPSDTAIAMTIAMISRKSFDRARKIGETIADENLKEILYLSIVYREEDYKDFLQRTEKHSLPAQYSFYQHRIDHLRQQVCSKIETQSATLPASRDAILKQAEHSLTTMIGLDEVKQQVERLKAGMQVNFERRLRGIVTYPINLNMIYVGAPGTGKTTIAGIIGKIFYGLGYLTSYNLIHVSRENFLRKDKSPGHIMNELFDAAIDGVLFIDEAYSIMYSNDDSGREIVDTLVNLIEQYADRICVILAGYTKEMERLISVNPGLRSRFARKVSFPRYTITELISIAHATAVGRNSILDPAIDRFFYKQEQFLFSKSIRENVYIDELGNARFVRSLIQLSEQYRDQRLQTHVFATFSNEMLQSITVEDISEAFREITQQVIKGGIHAA